MSANDTFKSLETSLARSFGQDLIGVFALVTNGPTILCAIVDVLRLPLSVPILIQGRAGIVHLESEKTLQDGLGKPGRDGVLKCVATGEIVSTPTTRVLELREMAHSIISGPSGTSQRTLARMVTRLASLAQEAENASSSVARVAILGALVCEFARYRAVQSGGWVTCVSDALETLSNDEPALFRSCEELLLSQSKQNALFQTAFGAGMQAAGSTKPLDRRFRNALDAYSQGQ